MDHAEARELLEDAALEPAGLDRLEAGDSPEAAALAGHLVGCPDCSDELERLRRSVRVLRVAFGAISPDRSVGAAIGADAPPAELRERTLGYVRALGRVRGPIGAEGPAHPVSTEATIGPISTAGTSGPTSTEGTPGALQARAPRARRRGPVPMAGWLMGLAAALVVGIGIGGFAAGRLDRGGADTQAASVAALARVDAWTMRIAATTGAESIALAGPSGSDAGGSLLYSPTSGEVVVVMNGISRPEAGREYRCWVRSGDTTAAIGRMYFGGDVGYWTGASTVLARIAPGATFGVSLVDISTGSPVGDPVLTGTL